MLYPSSKGDHARDYRVVKVILVPERIMECVLLEAVSAHMKEKMVPGNSSMDLPRFNKT